MANILEEYLVSVKYVVDKASENKFLEGLKHFAHSALGINLEIATLIGGLTELTKKLAETGEKWYWMGQQMGQSVGDLMAASDALQLLGMSTDAANASLAGFSNWTRYMGPAAQSLMRGLGVTATDTVGQLRQLGPILARMGGADPNNPNYWLALRWEQRMGISPELGLRLATGRFAREEEEARGIRGNVFGVGAGGVDSWMKTWSEQAEKMMHVFREFGIMFSAMRQYFGAQLFNQLIPVFQHWFELIQKHMPTIRDFLRIMADLVGMFFRLLDVAASVFDRMLTWFERLPTGLKYVFDAIALLGLALLRTPFGKTIAALSMLLLLLDDYMVWQQKGKSMFDWSAFDKAFKSKPDDGWLGWLEKVAGHLENIALWGMLIFGPRGFFRMIGGILGRVGGALGLGGLGRLLGGVAARRAGAAAGGALAAGTGVAAFASGVGEILIGAAIAALIYKAGEWLFTNKEVQEVLKEGAEGFWDFLKSIFQNQSEMDPTTGSVQQPQGIVGRLFQGAGGVGPSGDPAKEAEVMGILQSKYGLSKEDAAAWVSNWEAESGLRPDITSGGGGYNEASSRAYGLMQWIGPRLAALRKFAAEHHMDIRKLDTQLAFWWEESHSPQYRRIWEHLARAHGQEKAWTVFHEGESGGDPGLEKYGPGHVARYGPLTAMPSVAPVSGVGGKGSQVVQNNNTNINLQHGPNAPSTATAVADKQTQVNREQVRSLRQAVR
jgi:hypothetical protein